jgi:hypothetical protein
MSSVEQKPHSEDDLLAKISAAAESRLASNKGPMARLGIGPRISGYGTELPIRNVCASVAIGGKADDICSL